MGKLARHLLRDNLRRLLDERVARFTDLVQTGAVSKSTLARLRDEDGQSCDLDQLDAIAYALQVEPWQLLHPDFDTAVLSEWAMKVARKMEDVPEGIKPRAYARFVQDVDFANAAVAEALGEKKDEPASAPGTVKPRRLRRLPR